MGADISLDRLAMRARPPGSPMMEQNWNGILFLHWPMQEAAIRHLVPPALEIDTFDNSAWIGVTPFDLSGLRLYPMPPIPGISSFEEINVRTYVYHQGIPGIYFFSLDASKLLPALAARVFYQLPYYAAHIEFSKSNGEYQFKARRSLSPSIGFSAKWRRGMRLRAPDTESLAFFLVERYCFFTETAGSLSMTRAYHAPWILEEAVMQSCESTLLGALGLPEPSGEPLTHFSEGVNVQIWPPVPV
ncbi:MAG TPA: DUF2071 domain-containing protein [Patescibacteria group bacterium]|nr:DUF2071 domain-containing protein [Patescibacteria group bacterium]